MRKNRLLTICMAVLLSFTFLLAYSPVASALVSMDDLDGVSYRLVTSPPNGTYTTKSRGSIVTFRYEGDDLIGRMTTPSPTSTFSKGDVVFTNMYVDNAQLFATIVFGNYTQDVVHIISYDHGSYLKVEGDKNSGNDQELYWGMRRI